MLERTAATRAAILDAAAKLVGQHGYAGCSIAKVTADANIAHGTFYLHFKSQQQLFDELLPSITSELLDSIAAAMRGATGIYDLEQRSLQANLEFLKMHPYLYRVISEAEIHAPVAFARYIDEVSSRYKRFLRRIGFIGQDDEASMELEAFVTILEGARMRLLMRFGLEDNLIVGLPDPVIHAYLTFVVGGLEAAVKSGAGQESLLQ
ncbi:TetR/AcrR family transcriptional regulator [Croceicoccus sediminis]|uniref:TetR/AcrR family transcriptional regulator n=1 Tax=Croceicoccus sediminis TaxID=2571150 RepID=UPI0014782735|nr:TetR/AcrR family transcriptional regulator [Croceicoccus sediminis]